MMRKVLWLIVAAAAGIALGVLLVPRSKSHDRVPGAVARVDGRAVASDPDWDAIRQWLERPAGQRDPTVHFRILRPGLILPPDALARPSLPENTTITITRQGNKPAQIVVQQGDKRWEVDERELDKLPPQIRQCVEQMLGPWCTAATGGDKVIDLVPDGPAAARTPRKNGDSNVHKQMEEMNRQMEQIRRQLENLRAD